MERQNGSSGRMGSPRDMMHMMCTMHFAMPKMKFDRFAVLLV
jgi:hypothetical protein